MGCVTGDAIVSVMRQSGTRKYTLRDLYRKFNRIELTSREKGFSENFPTYIRGKQNDGIRLNKIFSVYKSGLKNVLRLTLSGGYSLKATADHKIYTKEGYKELRSLKLCDLVAVDILTKHKKKGNRRKSKKPRYNLWQVGEFYPYGYMALCPRKERLNRVESVHKIIYQANLNNISPEKFIELTRNERAIKSLKFIDPNFFHIHHIDHNPKNNLLENLVCIPASEHLKLHGSYENFSHGKITWRRVKSILDAGTEMTYDVSCEDPHNSFVANQIVVHNSGKTTCAIALLRAKYNVAKRVRTTLIVSPVATLHNWKNEFKINAPQKVVDACQIVYGAGPKRLKLLADETKHIFITNPEALTMPIVVSALQKKQIECVIIDEADGFKNHKSKRLQNLLTITDKASMRCVMTGTPILNSYMDLWALYRILDRGDTFNTNFFHFREKYFRDENLAWKGRPNYFPSYVPKAGIDFDISQIMAKKCVRLKKSDCLDLPPLVKIVEHVELSDEQRSAYEEMEADLITEVKEGTCVAVNALTKVLRMLQILSGYVQVETDQNEKIEVTLKKNPRLQRLKELLEQLTPHHKVIVWCVFKENYVTIRKLLEELGIEWAELTGETNDRQAEIDRFTKSPTCKVFISNPKAGGVGINLVEASYSIYYSRSFSLRDRLQSEARNHRGGSEIHDKITQIDLVSPGTLDETVLNALENKEEFAEKVLERIRLHNASGVR